MTAPAGGLVRLLAAAGSNYLPLPSNLGFVAIQEHGALHAGKAIDIWELETWPRLASSGLHTAELQELPNA